MIKTNRASNEGELLIRRMSDKAQAYYNGTDGIQVYAFDRDDNEEIEVSFDFGSSFATYTFDELQKAFEEMSDEIDD